MKFDDAKFYTMKEIRLPITIWRVVPISDVQFSEIVCATKTFGRMCATRGVKTNVPVSLFF